MQCGFVERLLYVHIDGAGNVTQASSDALCDCEVGVGIEAGDRDVDRGRRAEVQDLRDDVGGLKEKLDAGKAARQLSAKFVDVIGGGAMIFIKLDEDFAVGRAESAGVAVTKIDAGIRDAEVVEKGLQFVRGNGLANRGVDLVGQPRGFFDAQAGARAEVHADLAGVNFGEEITAEDEEQAAGEEAKNQKARRKHD